MGSDSGWIFPRRNLLTRRSLHVISLVMRDRQYELISLTQTRKFRGNVKLHCASPKSIKGFGNAMDCVLTQSQQRRFQQFALHELVISLIHTLI